MTQTQKERRQLVVKSNEIIQNCKNKLTTKEQKVFLYAASKIKPGDEELPELKTDVKTMCSIFGIRETGADYRRLKEAIIGLQNNSIQIKQGKWISYSIMPEAEIDGTAVTLRFSPRLKQFFLYIQERFTAYELENILPMKSQYSIVLFELFKSWVGHGGFEISVDDLRDNIGADGDSYNNFSDFRVKILDKSIKEIEHFTSLRIRYTKRTENRIVKYLCFEVSDLSDVCDDIEESKHYVREIELERKNR